MHSVIVQLVEEMVIKENPHLRNEKYRRAMSPQAKENLVLRMMQLAQFMQGVKI